ncbi:MAG: response regulator transcription factor [Labilithrix sp.]|nr:response regulator transcription factor [Labilithrix sp.]
MRGVRPWAYAELRAMYGLFPGVLAYFVFVTEHLMKELCPSVTSEVTKLSRDRLGLSYRIRDGLVGSRSYFDGTVTLLEIFPTHHGLPEAKVVVQSCTDRSLVLIADFPTARTRPVVAPPIAGQGVLTAREEEVLRYLCEGLTNAEIASALGTAPNTVKSQVSAILGKMGASNRTELAARASRT